MTFHVGDRVEIDKGTPSGDRTGVSVPGPRKGKVINFARGGVVVVKLDQPEGKIRTRFVDASRLTKLAE